MKDLGEIHWLLNLKIDRDKISGTINISQEAYIDNILARFNLQDAKSYSSPLDPNVKLSKDQCPIIDKEKKTMEKVPYRQAIRSLMWAAVATQCEVCLRYFYQKPVCNGLYADGL